MASKCFCRFQAQDTFDSSKKVPASAYRFVGATLKALCAHAAGACILRAGCSSTSAVRLQCQEAMASDVRPSAGLRICAIDFEKALCQVLHPRVSVAPRHCTRMREMLHLSRRLTCLEHAESHLFDACTRAREHVSVVVFLSVLGF